MDKRSYILKTAIKQFAANGYHETTMSALASNCNVSKATLYKFFPSKEELVLEAFLYLGNEIQSQAEAVDLQSSLTPHEKLEKKLEAIMRAAINSMDFHSIMRHALPGNIPIKYKHIMHRNQMEMAAYFRRMIVSAYGEAVEDISWDVTLCLMGMLHEFMTLRKMDNPMDYGQFARFTVNCLDGIVEKRKGKKPLFNESYISKHIKKHAEHDATSTLEGIKHQANNMNKSTREKILAATVVIEEHLSRGKAEWIIIEGMLSMLGEYPELAERVEKLRRSLECS